MKCADIPDGRVLYAIAEAARIRSQRTASRWDVTAVLAGHAELVGVTVERFWNMPENLVLAKLRKLVRRGLVDGCACGCRGDFIVLTPDPVRG